MEAGATAMDTSATDIEIEPASVKRKLTAQQREAGILAKINIKGHQDRAAEVVGVDVEARTVELAFSSEAEVERWFGIEILSHSDGACDLSRLNDGGAVLDGHDRAKQIGVVQRAWIGSDYRGRAVVRFSRNSAGQEMLKDVIDGVRRHVSVGYSIEELRCIEDREGTDVLLVTRWQPHEISIVSVPADVSVGIGRSANAPVPAITMRSDIAPLKESRNMSRLAKDRAELAGMEINGKRRSLASALRVLMTDAANAPTHRAHTPVGAHEPTAFIPIDATRSILACLSGDNLPGLFDAKGRLRRTPQAAPSVDELRMDAAIVANSRVVRAGAGLVIMPEITKAHAVGRTGDVVFEHTPGFVRHVDAAVWDTVDLDSLVSVPVSASPITSVAIDWNSAIAKTVRFEIPRKDRKSYGDQDKLCEEIIAAITLGLARAADEVLLSALSAAPLTDFTLAKAASEGLFVDELRGLVGTNATGAAFAADGALRAAGVASELTPDMAGTIVGAWNRAAVAVRDDVDIIFQRTGNAGAMEIIAWVSMLPLIPVASKFWTVA